MKRRFSIAPIQRVGSQRKHPADFDFVLRRPCALCARIGWRDAYSDSIAGRGYVLVPAGAFAYRIVVTKESAISAERISAWLLFLAAALAPLPFGSNKPILIPSGAPCWGCALR
jgi:hypothetical protein